MVNSLCLSHLPKSVSHSPTIVEQLKSLKDAPKVATLAKLLIENGFNTVNAWKILLTAQNHAYRSLELLRRKNISVSNYWSVNFPKRLKNLEQPPWNLFYIGNLPENRVVSLSIVGSRKPTPYGLKILNVILPQVKFQPFQIVSGLAFGIDSHAHELANKNQIKNYAVLGCGINQMLCRKKENLMNDILNKGGGILSEFPPNTPGNPWNFPWRNRIISGLSDLVWVVQGTLKSGSKHTVRHALAQGRPVATTPGNIFCQLSELPNQLIFDGSHMIIRPNDLGEFLKSLQIAIKAQ